MCGSPPRCCCCKSPWWRSRWASRAGCLPSSVTSELPPNTGTRALDVARVVAYAPAVRADVARYDNAPLTPSPALTDELAGGQLQLIASEVQKRTDVLFVVITNNQGIRLAHPNRDELGQHVSTDPAEALAGHEVVERQSGHARTIGARESPCPAAGFESSGGRGQRRHLDVRSSSAAVD